MASWLGRTAQLTLLAADVVGVRVGGQGPQAERRLVDRLGRLHGLPQKIGQLLALRELGGPSAYTPLTESAATLPGHEALALVESALGRRSSDCFRSFEPLGVGASLGQVHRAVLHDDRTAAVKVQYPDSRANVETDLQALSWLTLPFGGLGRGFDLAGYQHEVGGMLRQEVDYRQEARALERFAGLAAGFDRLVVPRLVPELSGDRVLTMTWLEGETLESACRWPEQDRRAAAGFLLRLFLTSCFTWRFLHADPHPGNYRFLRGPDGVRIGLLDFGCVLPVDEPTAQSLAFLVEAAGGTAEQHEVLAAYRALGFNAELLQPLAHLLPGLNAILFEPFATPGPFALDAWKLGERVEALLGPFRWNFRCAGPARLIFLVRAYLGLIRYQHALNVAIDWSEAWRQTVASVPPPRPQSPPPAQEQRTILSRHLRVRVQEAGHVRVDLTFRAILAESLPDLVPPELHEQLHARNIDVQRIAADAANQQFAPGELFQLTEGARQVRVWLE